MRATLFFLISILLVACNTTSKTDATNKLAANNKDIIILSALISNQFRLTNKQDLNLIELIQNDTLKRIANNFKEIKVQFHGGYISVYYKYSETRDTHKIELTNKESELIHSIKWIEKDMKEPYDGEMQFDYGERFYRIKKIIIKKE